MIENNNHQQRAKIFTALSDATRLHIVELLSDASEMSTSQIAECLSISLSLACHHTKALAEVGLIEKRKEGQTTYNLLNKALLVSSLGRILEKVYHSDTS